MNIARQFAVASFALGLTATNGASAASPVAFLTSPFGYSAVLEWSACASNSSPVLPGVTPGRADFQDITVPRNIDGQSPLFYKAAITGQHLLTR